MNIIAWIWFIFIIESVNGTPLTEPQYLPDGAACEVPHVSNISMGFMFVADPPQPGQDASSLGGSCKHFLDCIGSGYLSFRHGACSDGKHADLWRRIWAIIYTALRTVLSQTTLGSVVMKTPSDVLTPPANIVDHIVRTSKAHA